MMRKKVHHFEESDTPSDYSEYQRSESPKKFKNNNDAKNKDKPSILKYTNAPTNQPKKKCKLHTTIIEPSSSSKIRNKNSAKPVQVPKKKLQGILKPSKEYQVERAAEEAHIMVFSSEEEYDEYSKCSKTRKAEERSRCLVGRVPRPPGSKPGRGGGFAIVVKKAVKVKLPPEKLQRSKLKLAKSRVPTELNSIIR